nr:MAG TPA: hypothetical protein [Bacteriophage sp.]DAY43360.1 MAG TPA: hypothetical protein [Caudoviricetes sp.]
MRSFIRQLGTLRTVQRRRIARLDRSRRQNQHPRIKNAV